MSAIAFGTSYATTLGRPHSTPRLRMVPLTAPRLRTVPLTAPRLRTVPLTAPRLRITRRGRAVVTVLIAIPLAVGAAMLGVGAVGAAAGTHSSTTSFQYVTVEPGESLWQLAKSVAPAADPRDVVADILTLNNLSSSDLQPGQRLAVPTKYAH